MSDSDESKRDADMVSEDEDEVREFVVPMHLDDLELVKRDRIYVLSVTDFADLHKTVHAQQLQELQTKIQRDPLGIVESDVFDVLYSFLKAVKYLNEDSRKNLVFLANSAVNDIVKQIRVAKHKESSRHARSALKIATYVLCHLLMKLSKLTAEHEKDIVNKKDKAAKTNMSAWGKHFETSIDTLQKSLCDEALALWNMHLPEEEFIGVYTTAVFQLLESPVCMKSRTLKGHCFNLVSSCLRAVPSVHLTVTTSLLELVFAHEQLSLPIGDLIQFLHTRHNNAKIASDLINEIAKIRQRESSRDVSGTKNVSNFFGHLSKLMPSVVHANLSIVLPLLDADSYYLRNAVVTAVTNILMADFAAKDKAAKLASATAEEQQDDAASEEDEDDGADRVIVDKTFRVLSKSRRDALFSVLEDRVHDVNSYARSHVIKCYKDLCERGAVPLVQLQALPKLVVARMADKTATVRKQSVQLLTTLLERNPFQDSLDRQYYKERLDAVAARIRAMKEAIQADVTATLDRRMSGMHLDENEIAEKETEKEEELTKLHRLGAFYEQAVAFIDVMEKEAIPLLLQLLRSSVSTDVLEAIAFFHAAHAFRFEQATRGVRGMLLLVWRADPAIQEALLKTFQSVLFFVPNTSTHLTPAQAAQTLLTLLDGCTVSDATCLEQLLAVLHAKHMVPERVVAALWDLCTAESSCHTVGHAIWLLSMLTTAKTVHRPARLALLLEHGLGERVQTEHSWLCVRATAQMLQRWNLRDKAAATQEHLGRLVVRLQGFLTMNEDTNADWFDAAQQAIEALFHVCQYPEEPCGDIIATWSSTLFPTDEEEQQAAACTATELAKFVFLLGHIAIRMAVYVESVASSVKDARSKSQPARDEPQQSMEEELGMTAEIEAEDDEFLQLLTQHELVGANLLGAYGPVLVRLVANEDGAFDDEMIRETAIVALCKFMCISSDFCEKNLPLVFTKLKESEQPSVRCNIVVALGDLSFRFPNLVEPWTSHIYARLRDIDTDVRKNTIMVLTHLILNDMVKVKGQISEIALCLVDDESRIKDLAKLFFHELSKRGNSPIYNMLPDTIGRLSTSDLPKDQFREITKFLIGFVQKDKQNESLVDKMCQRFVTTTDVAQWRDLAFCLSNLSFNDKAIKKMLEQRKVFKQCLIDDTVFESFEHIVAKCKKSCKPEMKETVDELERVVQTMHANESNEEESETYQSQKPVEKRKKPVTGATPRKARAKRTKKTKTVAEDADEDEDMDDLGSLITFLAFVLFIGQTYDVQKVYQHPDYMVNPQQMEVGHVVWVLVHLLDVAHWWISALTFTIYWMLLRFQAMRKELLGRPDHDT
ncbi:condensin complex subunit [Achlya hypogyna]|uniref:Condensin complex subunit n=1 Tax=Achlya hypogyna TaxID=1202772 RepID=A0A1V9YNA9_ACHHY|nr:condensin complex subunit [Achlya hypogyna]